MKNKMKNDAAIENLKGVKKIVAVASGKGGVGKSTVAVNLALALSKKGFKTGLLDADIYGPSVPGLLGLDAKKPQVVDNKIVPVEKKGIKVMSMAFMLEENAAVIWRGPLMSGAIKQFLTDVKWEELDFLVVDLPPGTGDASLTIAQSIPLAGIFIVTTPQRAASVIASKAASMFTQMGIKTIGIVENMSYFKCPKCGEKTEIFKSGGASDFSKKSGLEILVKLPVVPGFMDGETEEEEEEEEIKSGFLILAEKAEKI